MNTPTHAARSSLGDVPLYASIGGRMASLGNEEVVFFDPESNRSHVMTAQVIEALELCRPFATMDEHVKNVASRVQGLAGQEAAVRRVLEGLTSRGLLVSDDAFLRRMTSVPAVPVAEHAGLFVRACDRPEQLSALLDSLPDGEAALERLVVMDDSREATSVEQHAARLSSAGGREVFHVTPDRWQAFEQALAAELPEHAELLGQLLRHDPGYRGPVGGGQGRNLITLLSAGRRHLLLDDDNLFPLARHPEASASLQHEALAWAPRTFSAQDEAMSVGEVDPDAASTLLDLCGRTLGELVRDGRLRFGREELVGRMPSVEPLLRGDLRVSMAVNGHRGGSCASGVNWLLLLDPQARAGLLADEARYRQLRGDPAVWFGCSAFAATRLAQFTPFSVDNSLLLPCTSPFGRSEDAVFNALASAMHPGSVQLHVPWSVGHRPQQGRDRSALYAQADTPDVNQSLADLIMRSADEIHAEAPEARAAAIAARIEDLAAGSERNLLAYLGEFLAYRRTTLIAQMQQVLAAAQRAPIPDWFFADLRAQIEANGRAVVERKPPRFAGWPEEASAAQSAARFREQAAVLARGLRAWPAIREAAAARAGDFLGSCRI
ncbi:hypothetical protein [Pseudomarimonas salicorniae]|uniref:Uncharacterized protein n=1 Tax=Pseudomarimonas salicorniae TaxID=2933270 RepID=A0ABT0GJ74_9GAMM|nr:hypothetical protein [Lysobacter sp. CAU 1642]MCK7594592.1 hypothetical protein [Lysobacter sp. CAU 1642]